MSRQRVQWLIVGAFAAWGSACGPGPVLDLGDDIATGNTGESGDDVTPDAGPMSDDLSLDGGSSREPDSSRRTRDAGHDADDPIPNADVVADAEVPSDSGEPQACKEDECVACQDDADCQVQEDNTHCGVANVCIDCAGDADCHGEKNHCDPQQGCAECVLDEHCPAGKVCDAGECE